MALHESGALTRHNVKLIGAQVDAIRKGEDRQLFKECMAKIGLECARSATAHTMPEAHLAMEKIGTFPLIIRPAFTLGGTGGGAGYAGIHFDNDHSSCAGADSKLDIGTACLDADFADDSKGGVAHALKFAIGQSLGWGDGNAVAGVNSHGIEVFDGADDDAVIRVIAHDFHFVLFPALEQLVN